MSPLYGSKLEGLGDSDSLSLFHHLPVTNLSVSRVFAFSKIVILSEKDQLFLWYVSGSALLGIQRRFTWLRVCLPITISPSCTYHLSHVRTESVEKESRKRSERKQAAHQQPGARGPPAAKDKLHSGVQE